MGIFSKIGRAADKQAGRAGRAAKKQAKKAVYKTGMALFGNPVRDMKRRKAKRTSR